MRPWIGLTTPSASRDVSFKNCDDEEGEALSPEEDSVQLQAAVNSQVDLEQTTYDAIAVVVICSQDSTYCERHGHIVARMWVLTAILLHIFIILLQLTIVVFLLVTTVHTSSEPWKAGVREKAQMILEAVAKQERLAVDQQPMASCEEMDVLQRGHLVIQFIWSARMLQEFVEAMWRAFYINNLRVQRSTSAHSERMLQEDAQGTILLTHTGPCTAWTLLVISSAPQMLCACLLWWTGAKFLFFAHSMGTLVMKSISIAFITTLDEMLFKSFASQGFKDVVKNTKYLFSTVKPNRHFYMWGVGVIKFLTAFGLAGFIYWGVFGHVTEFRTACWAYWNIFPADIPNRGNESVWNTFLESIDIE